MRAPAVRLRLLRVTPKRAGWMQETQTSAAKTGAQLRERLPACAFACVRVRPSARVSILSVRQEKNAARIFPGGVKRRWKRVTFFYNKEQKKTQEKTRVKE